MKYPVGLFFDLTNDIMYLRMNEFGAFTSDIAPLLRRPCTNLSIEDFGTFLSSRQHEAVRRDGQASLWKLAARYGINPKTVCEMAPAHFGLRRLHGTETSLDSPQQQEAVAFHKHTLLPLDDCLSLATSALEIARAAFVGRTFTKNLARSTR
jgi:hypothetical protein